MKIYVIGSLSQEREIMLIANALSTIKDNEVRSVKCCKELSLEECINRCYKNIDWCDTVFILRKENGTLGDGTTYEKVYAEKQSKEIIYISQQIIYE